MVIDGNYILFAINIAEYKALLEMLLQTEAIPG